MKGYYYQLTRNGWFYSKENRSSTTQDYSVYEFKLQSEYPCLIRAYIAENKEQMEMQGDYGVLWIEIVDIQGITIKEGDLSLGFPDLKLMENALIYAEENLLKIGIPFTAHYKFHTKNAIKNKKNMTSRKRAKLNERKIDRVG